MTNNILLNCLPSLIYNEHWPYMNMALHTTCKRFYDLWVTHLRDKTIAWAVLEHSKQYRIANITHAFAGYLGHVIYWDMLPLYMCEAPLLSYTVCGKRHAVVDNDTQCNNILCRVYGLSTRRSESVGRVTFVNKYDIINGILYSFTTRGIHHITAMNMLHDCSLGASYGQGNTTITISRAGRGLVSDIAFREICQGQLFIYEPNVVRDLSCTWHTLDNKCIACVPDGVFNKDNEGYLRLNIYRILMYMRSTTCIDSVQYLGYTWL